MATVSHALRGWWRYSRLTFIPVGSNVIVAVCLAVPAFIEHNTVEVAIVEFLTVVLLAQLGWGAVNAERARRCGCR